MKFLSCLIFLGCMISPVQAEETISEKLNQKSYELAKDQNLPMSVEQIEGFLKDLRESQKVSVEAQELNPEKRVKIEVIPLDPGSNIPTVHTAQGYVSTISLLDASGAGWPIVDVVSGGNFTITPPEENGHIIRLTPNVRYGHGNISLRLKDLEFPITLNIEVGDEFVDYRFDAKVPLPGPDGDFSILTKTNIDSAGNATLSSILEGVIPEGMKKLQVLSGDMDNTTVYQQDNKLCIRTMATLLSPRWDASASINSGLRVYTLKESPVLLFSDGGEIVKLKVKLLKED